MKKHVNLLLLLFMSVFVEAQQFCGTDEMHQQLYQADSGLHQKIVDNHNWLNQFTKNYVQEHYDNRQTVTFTIPVVFHIIHLNGPENISDAQIYDQMRIINEDYQKRNADTSAVITAFKPIAADCEIAFKLAKIDPDGNCTKGITRHVDGRTLTGTHNVKEIVHWPPDQYLNIYVCAQAAGLAGHALVPSAADTISQWDGIVIQHAYVGDIGTGDPSRSVVLTHEIGHYLNLYHTWGGNNVPGYPYLPVAQSDNCNHDDDVADTPNTIGWQTCNVNHQSCGSLDNVQNFMEYAYCPAMFTNGQKLRMHATLSSPIAGRNNLVSASNLLATGVDLPDAMCAVDFRAERSIICEGQSVQFSDQTYHNATAWQWYFEGGTPSSSTDQHPSVTYAVTGDYTVKLWATDGTTQDSLIIENYLKVLPSPGASTSIIETFDPHISLKNTQLFSVNDAWFITDQVGKNSQKSITVANLGEPSGLIYEFISEPINFGGVSGLELSFDYAFAQTATNNQDKLTILTSSDCGLTWTVRRIIQPTLLNTAGNPITQPFFPTEDQWQTSVTTLASALWVNNLQVMFRFQSGGGNHIYIDNINFFDPAQSAIVDIATPMVRIFPNPATNHLTVIHAENSPTQILLLDVTGRLVLQQTAVSGEVIELGDLSQGVYLLAVYLDNKMLHQLKLIKN
jgi:PKD repeat protein